MAAEYAGRVRFVKVDIDLDEPIREKFGISGIPAYLVFKNGEEVDRLGVTFTSMFLQWRVGRMLDGVLD